MAPVTIDSFRPLHPVEDRVQYVKRRQKALDEVRLNRMTSTDLANNIEYLKRAPLPTDVRAEWAEQTRRILPALYGWLDEAAQAGDKRAFAIKGILDSTGSTTGSVLIRQDFDPILRHGGCSA